VQPFPIRPTDRPAGPGPFANPTWLVIGVLVAVRLLVGLTYADGRGVVGDPDVTRFHQIATSEGRPYRDFEVEYAPAETIAIHLLAGGDRRSTAVRLVVVALVCDLIALSAIWYGWSRRTAALYLLIGLPLVPFIYLRLDPLVVALAVWGLALARRGRERTGGATLALAALTKFWPLVVAPAFLAERRERAARWFAGMFAAGMVAWVAFGGFDGIRQVLSFRDATGWEVESTVGSIVWLVTGGPIRLEAGASRTGMIPGWSRPLLLALLIASLLAIWTRARDRDRDVDAAGGPALAAVGALLALSPLFSLQYALWIAPWSAVAWSDPRTARWGRVGFDVLLLTGVLAFHAYLAQWIVIGLLLVRNCLCVWLVIGWLAFGPTSRTTNARGVTRATR
jgi:glycosyl transferase family 87